MSTCSACRVRPVSAERDRPARWRRARLRLLRPPYRDPPRKVLMRILKPVAAAHRRCPRSGVRRRRLRLRAARPRLELGYFPNLTHASAVYGVASGTTPELGPGSPLKTQTFNAGPGRGRGPVRRLHRRGVPRPESCGERLRPEPGRVALVAGATSGGASLVVRRASPTSRGKKIADPQTGGTQDIALRTYLAAKGLKVDKQGGGRRHDRGSGQQPDPRPVQGRVRSTGPGCPSRGRRAWSSRAAARSCSTRRPLWPGGKFVDHEPARAQGVPRGAPGRPSRR